MNTKLPLLGLGLGAIVVAVFTGALPTAPRVAEAQATSAKQYASAGPSASASASAAPTAHPDMVPNKPTLASRTLPTERSEPPKPDDWDKADSVQINRQPIAARSCTIQLIREYMKVSCPFELAGARQFAGSPKDVTLWVTPKTGENGQFFFNPPMGGYIIFPLRKGEGRIFQFFSVESGYEDIGLGDSVIIESYWADSDKSPTVTMH